MDPMSYQQILDEARRRRMAAMMGGGYQTPDDLIGGVQGAYAPIKAAAMARMGEIPLTDESPIGSALTGKLTQYADEGPRTRQELTSSYTDRFPEALGAGKNYGAFTTRYNPEMGKLQNYPSNGRVVTGMAEAPRSVNSLAPSKATAHASENRKARLDQRQTDRVAFQDKQREQNTRSQIMAGIMGNPVALGQYVKGMADVETAKAEGAQEGKANELRAAIAAAQSEDPQVRALGESALRQALVGSGEGATASSPIDPAQIAAGNASRLEAEKAAAQQLERNPAARDATIRDLIALSPDQLSPEIIRQNGVTPRDLFNHIAGNFEPGSPEWDNAAQVLEILDPSVKAELDKQVALHFPSASSSGVLGSPKDRAPDFLKWLYN